MGDIERLQGIWSVVALELDGSALPAGAFASGRIHVQGDRFTTTGMGAAFDGTLELDPSATPKSFDLVFTVGPEKGNRNVGIYELADDEWRICLATRGSTRPTAFETKSGTGMALEVLRRGDLTTPVVAPTVDVKAIDFEPALELVGEWKMVSGTLDGRPVEKRMLKMARRKVVGSDMSVTFGDYVHSRAKYSVDRSQFPPAIDIYNSEGPNAGKLQHGIYERTGNTLKLSVAAAGQARPADFTSSKGDGRTVVTWTLA